MCCNVSNAVKEGLGEPCEETVPTLPLMLLMLLELHCTVGKEGTGHCNLACIRVMLRANLDKASVA